MNFFFTGMKHSGKTTFAKRVAAAKGLIWADSDDLVLENIKPLTVREYYKKYGKEAFIIEERKAVEDFIEKNNGFVLSLGGGVCDNTPLMSLMKSSGKIIYLTRDEGLIFDKIMQKGLPPFLDTPDPRKTFHELFLRRDAIYRSYMDLEIALGPYSSKDETEKRVISILEETYGR